ncbi:MAG: HAMP domain-containing histidine kinase [Clostridia bacterium]|nr:HAMP domain-containing histidine kinase [Clostridia bacterium]
MSNNLSQKDKQKVKPVSKGKNNGKKKRKPAVFELIYALICILATATFCIVPILLFASSGALTFNFPHGYAFLIFVFICSVGAGFFLFYKQYLNRTTQAKKVYDACNKILKGEYEIDLEDLSSEFKKVGDVLIAVSHRLKLADKEKNDFINDFSHELKTPIVSIRGFARLISKGNLTQDEAKEYLSIIVSESDRLIDLTASTLLLDRLENSNLAIEKEYYNVSEQIRKSVLLLQNDWEKKDIEIIADFDDCNVYSNAELTSQLFINVIQNAIKFSNWGDKIEITLSKTDKLVAVQVKDYGVGMDEETKKRMYDKYFRGDKSRSTHGNGLGLSTVRKIAELLDLELKVWSEPNKGTSFTVIFKSNR